MEGRGLRSRVESQGANQSNEGQPAADRRRGSPTANFRGMWRQQIPRRCQLVRFLAV